MICSRGQRPHRHVRRARGALAAALRPHRPRPSPPPALAGGSLKYFLLGAFARRSSSSAPRCSTGTPARSTSSEIATAITTANGDLERTAPPRRRPGPRRPALQGRRGRRSTRGRRTSTRARRRRSPASWPRAPRPRRSARSCAWPTSASRPRGWEWRNGVVVVALLTMVVGAVLSVTQTDMKRLLAYSSIAHAGFILVGVLAFDVHRRVRACCSTSSPTASRRSPPSPSSRSSAGRRRGDAPLAVGRPRRNAPGRRRRLRVAPARLRRHPADVGLQREVRGVRAADRHGGAAGIVLAVVGVLASPSRCSSTSGSSC